MRVFFIKQPTNNKQWTTDTHKNQFYTFTPRLSSKQLARLVPVLPKQQQQQLTNNKQTTTNQLVSGEKPFITNQPTNTAHNDNDNT
jgi:hypothetical protein